MPHPDRGKLAVKYSCIPSKSMCPTRPVILSKRIFQALKNVLSRKRCQKKFSSNVQVLFGHSSGYRSSSNFFSTTYMMAYAALFTRHILYNYTLPSFQPQHRLYRSAYGTRWFSEVECSNFKLLINGLGLGQPSLNFVLASIIGEAGFRPRISFVPLTEGK
jgi:hypothetical protein